MTAGMESSVGLLMGLGLLALYVVMIVKFFEIARNVAALKTVASRMSRNVGDVKDLVRRMEEHFGGGRWR